MTDPNPDSQILQQIYAHAFDCLSYKIYLCCLRLMHWRSLKFVWLPASYCGSLVRWNILTLWLSPSIL